VSPSQIFESSEKVSFKKVSVVQKVSGNLFRTEAGRRREKTEVPDSFASSGSRGSVAARNLRRPAITGRHDPSWFVAGDACPCPSRLDPPLGRRVIAGLERLGPRRADRIEIHIGRTAQQRFLVHQPHGPATTLPELSSFPVLAMGPHRDRLAQQPQPPRESRQVDPHRAGQFLQLVFDPLLAIES